MCSEEEKMDRWTCMSCLYMCVCAPVHIRAGVIYSAISRAPQDRRCWFWCFCFFCTREQLATLLPQIATLFITSIKQPTHQGPPSGGAVSRKSDNERQRASDRHHRPPNGARLVDELLNVMAWLQIERGRRKPLADCDTEVSS